MLPVRLDPAALKETPVEAVPAVVERALVSVAEVRDGPADGAVMLTSSILIVCAVR